MDASNPVSPEVEAAFQRSNLRSIAPETFRRLHESAQLVRLPAGAVLHREGDQAAHLQLIVSGLLRVYVTALDGRTLTVRYCRAGSVLGAVSLFSEAFSMPASVQAVTDSEVLAMSSKMVKHEVERDGAAARAIIDELSDRVLSFIAEIPHGAFTTVRQRVARHLLDLATASQAGSELRAHVTQQELADAVGSVREVVVRVLRELREEGVIETGHDGILIRAPEQLASEAGP